jgi:hypothetical protein
MQVFRQDDHRVNLKGTSNHDFTHGLPYHFDALFIDKKLRAIKGDNGKKVAATR